VFILLGTCATSSISQPPFRPQGSSETFGDCAGSGSRRLFICPRLARLPALGPAQLLMIVCVDATCVDRPRMWRWAPTSRAARGSADHERICKKAVTKAWEQKREP
jgi:hypothetical protein